MAQVIAVPHVIGLNLPFGNVTQRYYAFVPKSDETLWLNSSVDGGTSWGWQSLGGSPPGVASFAAATAFFSGKVASDNSLIYNFYCFVVARDLSLWVVVSTDDGKTWNWQPQGNPPSGANIAGPPDAVSRQAVNPDTFEQDVYCLVVGSDGHLYVNYSVDNGNSWHWADQGTPPGTTLAVGEGNSSHASSIAYLDGTTDRLFTFAIGDDQNLYANFWDGSTPPSTPQWLPLGHPPSGGLSKVSNFWPAPVTVPVDMGSIFVFVVGLDDHLWASHSPSGGTGWVWEDRGTPPTGSIGQFRCNVVRFSHEDKSRIINWRLFVFALDANIPSPLLEDFTPDALSSTPPWNWQPSSAPAGAILTAFVGAVTTPETHVLSDPHTLPSPIYVFLLDDQNDVHVRQFDGAQWMWLDQKGPF
jgi:hypothetical protein